MASMYPVEMRRCEHIKANGTQCGSPALKTGKFCYHHQECRPERVKVRGDGSRVVGTIVFPVFEDGTSIQMVVRQVAMMVLEKKIDAKAAGLVLYACQIAATNLKRMAEEKPRPVQVVVDTKKVAETPLGMTPWSAKGEGHQIEEAADSAARRALWELNDRWEEAHREACEEITEHLKGLDGAIRMIAPEANRPLHTQLSGVQNHLERVTAGMREDLEEGMM